MTSFSTTIICDIAALSLGVLLAVFATRVPKRGWVGLVLLVSSALAWSLIDSGDSSQPSRLPMLLIFLLLAPIAVSYSFGARRSAPDRLPALAAFVGAFVVSGFLLFMVAGIIYASLVVLHFIR